MRWMILFATLMTALFIALSCSDNGSEPPDDDPKTIPDASGFFPMSEGSFYIYNNGVTSREIDGDTTINGTLCTRLLQGGVTNEAWTKDASGFYQHLLDGEIWFDPPLAIPFDLVEDEPYDFYSLARQLGDTTALASLSGSLTFEGFVSREVTDYLYDSLLHLNYVSTIYNFAQDASLTDTTEEYWARGIGLVLSPDSDPNDGIFDELRLDSVLIDGVWLPRRE